MRPLEGYSETGRVVSGPDQELVELEADNGLRHLAIVFDLPAREHPCLSEGMDRVRGAMHQPGIAGLAPLVHDEPKQGAWVYACGTGWTLSEVIRELSRHGHSGSVRAGLELCYLTSEILLQASEMMETVGLHAHGSLDPTRIQVKPDGQVCVLGYALPPASLRNWADNSRQKPHMDALRYAPPERFKTEEVEDLSSDLFSLTLVGLELMVGRPVYDGLFDDLVAQAQDGTAVRRVYGWRNQLPAAVQEAMVRALKPDRDARYRSGNDYVYAMHDLLSSLDADGPSLREVLAAYRGLSSRGRLEGASPTGSFTPEELAELTADLDALEAMELAGPSKPRDGDEVEEPVEDVAEEPSPRWESKSKREAARAEEEQASRRDALRRSLKSRSRGGDDALPDDERDRLRRRLRRRSADEPESTGDAASPPRSRPRRLGGRRGGAEEEAPDEETVLAQDVEALLDEEANPPESEDAGAEPDETPPVEATPSAPGPARTAANALLERLKNLGAPPPEADVEPTVAVGSPPVPEPVEATPPLPEPVESIPPLPEPVEVPEVLAPDRAAPSDVQTFVLPDGQSVAVPSGLRGTHAAWVAVVTAGLLPLDALGRLSRGVALNGDRVSWVDGAMATVAFSIDEGGTRTAVVAMHEQTPVGWAVQAACEALGVARQGWMPQRDGRRLDAWEPVGCTPIALVRGAQRA